MTAEQFAEMIADKLTPKVVEAVTERFFGGEALTGLRADTDYQVLRYSPEMYEDYINSRIKRDYGITNPPRWLYCAYAGTPYRVA